MVNLRWLITGGCGFVGGRLVARLRQRNDQIRIVDNFSVGRLEDLPLDDLPEPVSAGELGDWGPLTVIEADIADAETARAAADGADVIVHLAANTGVMQSLADPRRDCETNVLGVLNYLEGARTHGVKRFVLASSNAPVGDQSPPIKEDLAPRPMSPYGASKLAGEGYCSAYWQSFGLETVVLRFSNVYGPGSDRKSSVVATFIQRALLGAEMVVHGDGRQSRDFIFVDDLCDALISAGTTTAPVAGEIFQIATGEERSIGELASALQGFIADRDGQRPMVIHENPRVGEMIRNFSDTSKARKLLKFAPQVGFEEGLQRTIDYFLDRRKN